MFEGLEIHWDQELEEDEEDGDPQPNYFDELESNAVSLDSDSENLCSNWGQWSHSINDVEGYNDPTPSMRAYTM